MTPTNETADINDGKPEQRMVRCECLAWCPDGPPRKDCPQCDGSGARDETDREYWARVEAMTPKSADDVL